jgi:hypothetical protein
LVNFGGFRDGQAKHNSPTTAHKMTGAEKNQPRSILVSVTIHDPLPDDPLPTTRECEKKIKAIIHATMELQTSINPNRRRDESVISPMPPNESAETQPWKQTMTCILGVLVS